MENLQQYFTEDISDIVTEEDLENNEEDDDGYGIGNFFRDNLMKVRRAVSEKDFKKFANLNTNGERVAAILALPEAHELPVEVENNERKNAMKADCHKKEGNTLFGLEIYPKAIEEYNQAAVLAPKEELGVILANRAAAFYHLDRFDLALRDCDEAFKVGYPKNLMYKLEERRARCLLGLKFQVKATEAFKRAITALDDATIPTEKKKKFESDMRVMLAVMNKGHEMNEAKHGVSKEKIMAMEDKSLRMREEDNIPRFKEANPLYPSLNKAVDVKYGGSDVGRYVVATRDIKPGEMLVIEKPHCLSILGEYRLTHCHRCSRRIGTAYPAKCYTCTSIAYCSPKCCEADEKVHKIECDILGSLWCSNTSVTCILALKAVIQRPFEEFYKMKDELKKTHGKLEITKAKPYLGRDYRTFYNLVTHEDERTPEDLFHRAFMAAYLLRVLKLSKYLPPTVKTPDNAGIKLSDGELFVADAILHHLQLLQFNSHEISEFVQPRGSKDLTTGKSKFVGGGVYPTEALLNHSCNPGVVRYFIGNTMLVRAIRTITAGSEVADNYGPIFIEVDEKERKRKLRLQYWFDCNCEACRDHWPLLQDIDPNILRFKCETGPSCGNILSVNVNTEMFMLACSKCGNSTNIMKGLKTMQDTDALYKTAMKHVKLGNSEDALKAFLEILKILDETLALPIRDYHLCQQGVRQCLLALGNSSIV